MSFDAIHTQMVMDFEKNDTIIIPELKEKRALCKKQLKDANLRLDERLDCIDTLRDTLKEIKALERKKKQYFLSNSKMIFEYYENEDQENRELITKEYINNFENKLDLNDYKAMNKNCCKFCHFEQLYFEDEGMLLCMNPECGRLEIHLDETQQTHSQNEITTPCYKRIEHFRKIILFAQGKGAPNTLNTQCLETIKDELIRRDMFDEFITVCQLKPVLKTMRLAKYYPHCAFILNALRLCPAPQFSFEFEISLFTTFSRLEYVYAQACPNNRKNFLNYSYTAYKLCELAVDDSTKQLKYHFKLLKNTDKLRIQDGIWSKMCELLDFVFIPTL